MYEKILRYTIIITFLAAAYTALTNSVQEDKPSIVYPGPDTENFPLSPFTLPPGHIYWENYPLYFELPNKQESYTYYCPFLLRFGMAKNIELRFSGAGLTSQHFSFSRHNTIGFSPLEIGIKVRGYGTQEMQWAPSLGIEAAIIPPLASTNLADSTQYRISALFYNSFTEKLSLEWNIGTYSLQDTKLNKKNFFALICWALEYDLSEYIGFFFEGLYTSAKQPIYPTTLLLGAGFLSNITSRICIYGSYNWPVFNKGSELVNFGYAIAF